MKMEPSHSTVRRPALELRAYVDSDLDEYLRMSLLLFPDAKPLEHARELSAFRARPDTAVFVIVREDGRLAGFVEAGSRPYVDGCDSSPVGYIEAWFVDEDVRLGGWGRALLNAAEEWARSRGYSEMGSDALLDNVVSHRAHVASGYDEVDRVVQFRKVL